MDKKNQGVIFQDEANDRTFLGRLEPEKQNHPFSL